MSIADDEKTTFRVFKNTAVLKTTKGRETRALFTGDVLSREPQHSTPEGLTL